MFFMQATMGSELVRRLPTFSELIYWYGPFLGLIIILVGAFMIMQYVWFKMLINEKKEEVKRLITENKTLFERTIYVMDNYTGFKK